MSKTSVNEIFLIIACMAFAPFAWAQQSPGGWSGTAGFGPLAFPRYVGGKSWRVWPVPLLSINHDETVYIELQRAGIYLLASEDKKVGLGVAIEPRFGYSQADGPRLGGMAKRKSTVEGGPTFDWDFDFFAVSLAWFNDLGASSRGNSTRVALYVPLLKNEVWDFGTLLAVDRLDGRRNDYYFGVRSNEATVNRAFFRPGSGASGSLGFSGTCNLDKHAAVMFGVIGTRLDTNQAHSPIVESRNAFMLYLGYGWRL